MEQTDLFANDDAAPPGIGGLRHETGFLSLDEEAALLRVIAGLPLAAAEYKGYTAHRLVLGFGGRFDFDTNILHPAPPLPEVLHPLRDKVAGWGGVPAEALAYGLVAAYPQGAALGWHRDVPCFEDVFGVSLDGEATMRFRPYPPDAPRRRDVHHLQLAPRSVYALRGEARWDWQHSVAPVSMPRWSVTFRTLRRGTR